MDALKEVGIYFITAMVGLLAYFLRQAKEESDKKITALFEYTNKLRDEVTVLRERLARIEK